MTLGKNLAKLAAISLFVGACAQGPEEKQVEGLNRLDTRVPSNYLPVPGSTIQDLNGNCIDYSGCENLPVLDTRPLDSPYF